MKQEPGMDIHERIHHASTGVVITNPRLPDNPIVYVNQGFTDLTGYYPDEVYGCNSRFLQGPATSTESIASIREGLACGQGVKAELLNYRKDGTPFWNRLDIVPIRMGTGTVAYYLGTLSEQSERRDIAAALQDSEAVASLLASSYERMSPSLLGLELRRALAEQRIKVHYQPIVQLHTGRWIGAEALIRWNHPQYGLISPAVFVPVAEKLGLICPIGEWVLREACMQGQAWRRAGVGGLLMSVNISPVQLACSSFVGMVKDALAESGLPPEQLQLEVTESVALAEQAQAGERLDALRQIGVRIAMDDFGAQYSSLLYLQRLPVTCIKLDMALIRDIPGCGKSEEIAKSVIRLAHSLGLDMVAEGIETRDQLAFLHGMQCPLGQGYWYSKPVGAPELVTRLHTTEDLFTDQEGHPSM